jgi:hypothetical protein
MDGMVQQPKPGSNDNSRLETGRNCQEAEWQAERLRELQQRRERRDREQRKLEESIDPSDAITRLRVRAWRRGLMVNTPIATGDAPGRSQPQPILFLAPDEPPKMVFTDPLPAYVDWRTFRYHGNGPGRGLARWLARWAQVPNADVIAVGSIGCAPLIADRCDLGTEGVDRRLALEYLAELEDPEAPDADVRPRLRIEHTPHSLPWQREHLRQELAREMSFLTNKQMQQMSAAFARDIHGMDTIGIAQTANLDDDFIYPRNTKKGKFVINGELRDKKVGSESRGGYRHAAAGRKPLSRLGAWPWCLTDSGRLPPQWYRKEEYATALATWHYRQTLATLAAIFRSTAATALDDDAREFARDQYRQAYMARA